MLPSSTVGPQISSPQEKKNIVIRAFKKSFHTLKIFLFFKRKKSAFAEFMLGVIFPQDQFTKYVVPVSLRYIKKTYQFWFMAEVKKDRNPQTPSISRKKGGHSVSLTKVQVKERECFLLLRLKLKHTHMWKREKSSWNFFWKKRNFASRISNIFCRTVFLKHIRSPSFTVEAQNRQKHP